VREPELHRGGQLAGTGNTLANVIVAVSATTTLDDGGVGGADTLNGGAGNDTYSYPQCRRDYPRQRRRREYRQYHPAQLRPGWQSPELTFIGTGNFAGTGTRLTTSSLAAPATTH